MQKLFLLIIKYITYIIKYICKFNANLYSGTVVKIEYGENKKLEYILHRIVSNNSVKAVGISAINIDLINRVLKIDITIPGRIKLLMYNPKGAWIKVLQKDTHKPEKITY